jgi:hypothetical protein
MKEPWCLATSLREAMAATLVNHSAKRWTTDRISATPRICNSAWATLAKVPPAQAGGRPEEGVRYPHRRATAPRPSAADQRLRHRIADTAGRRRRSLGMDRLLKSNTSTKRTYSVFRQGCMLYALIPTMPEHRLLPLMRTFNEAVSTAATFGAAFAMTK